MPRTTLPTPTRATARIDPTGRYRYALTRIWDPGAARVCFCLLNPSTADATTDDPTLRRCLGFARDWGFGGVEIVNLFALRATDPRLLRRTPDPVGPRNDAAIVRAARRADLIVAAWGNHGALRSRAEAVRALLSPIATVHALGITKMGHPRHPLYAPRSAGAKPLAAPVFRPVRTASARA